MNKYKPEAVSMDDVNDALGYPTIDEYQILNKFRDLCYDESKAKGWHSEDTSNFAAFCANLHSEASELWESWRKGTLSKPCDKASKMAEHNLEVLTSAEEELADLLIRTFDTAAELKVDLAKAVRGKLAFNRTRPHRNGGKLA